MPKTWHSVEGLDSAPVPIVEVSRRNDAWLQAAAAKDLDRMLSIYAEDAQELLPDMEPLVGRTQIRAFYAQLMENLPEFCHHFAPSSGTVSDSEDLVVMRGAYQFQPDAADPKLVHTGKYVGVWRKTRDRWELFLNISNESPSGTSP